MNSLPIASVTFFIKILTHLGSDLPPMIQQSTTALCSFFFSTISLKASSMSQNRHTLRQEQLSPLITLRRELHQSYLPRWPAFHSYFVTDFQAPKDFVLLRVGQKTKAEVNVVYSLVGQQPCFQLVKYPKIRIWSLSTCIGTLL